MGWHYFIHIMKGYTQMKKTSTYLKIEWSDSEGRHQTEVWQRPYDGKLYEIFDLLTRLMHRMMELKRKP